jgi:hypothetical protein
MKRLNPLQKPQRARARALQAEFIDAWGSNQSIRKAMEQTGVSWHRLQAWRRWDANFRAMYDSMRTLMDIIRHEDRQDLLFRKGVYERSERAFCLYLRLYANEKLCPICQLKPSR